MKNYTTFLAILSAVLYVAGAPKDLVIIRQEGDVTAAGNVVNHSSAPTNTN